MVGFVMFVLLGMRVVWMGYLFISEGMIDHSWLCILRAKTVELH